MNNRAIQPSGVATAAPYYSPAILCGSQRLLFISGQGPRDLEADVETQVRQTFEQIKAILREAGAQMRNLVMIRAYFLDMPRDLEVFRKVRSEFLVEPYPAATAVGVSDLAVAGLQVEIEAVAALD